MEEVLLPVVISVVVLGISLVAIFSSKRASEEAQQEQKSSPDCTDVNSQFLGRFVDECQGAEKPMLLATSFNEWLDAHNTRVNTGMKRTTKLTFRWYGMVCVSSRRI